MTLRNDGNPYAPLDAVVEDVVESEVEEKTVESLPEDVTTIKGILEWVGEDKDRAELVKAGEEGAEHPRKTLLQSLEEIING